MNCRVDQCPRDVVYTTQQLCNTHYKQEWRAKRKTEAVKRLGGMCSRCGWTPVTEDEICVFDFHHTGEKGAEVGNLLLGASMEKVMNEVDQCELLCANCHRIEHAAGG